MNKTPVTVIILTLNEEQNISQSVSSVIDWASQVIVLDSGSQDQTCEIAKKLGAEVHHHTFESYGKQRAYAISMEQVKHDWIFFLDADEYPMPELKEEIASTIAHGAHQGYFIKYRLYFLNKWIRYGGYYPTWILRLFNKNHAQVDRDVNEHILIDGTTGKLKHDFIHKDLKGVSDWVAKHNRYATMEAQELLATDERKRSKEKNDFAKLSGTQAQRKRWIKEYIWDPLLPPLIRPFIYFFFRYFIKLGFLDGRAGFVFHVLQGLWYIFLIDVKYLEMKWLLKSNKSS